MNKIYQKPFPDVKNTSKELFGPLFNKRHSRGMLSGIFRRYSGGLCRLNRKNNEDPRQMLSGMTTSFHKDPACAGFTLTELLVVVLIIGILAAVALPRYQRAVDKSRYVRTMPLVNAVQKAQEIYYMSNGTYAKKYEELDVSLPASYKRMTENSDAGGQCYGPKGWDGDHICTGPNSTFVEPFGVGKIQYQCKYENSPWKGKCFCVVDQTTPDKERWNALCQSLGTEYKPFVYSHAWKNWVL